MYKASKVYLCSPLHYVDGIPIDNMHAVLERATKWLMRAWLKSENHAQPFYLDRSVIHGRWFAEVVIVQVTGGVFVARGYLC